MKRTITVIAGPNGSGKTTFADSYLATQRTGVPFLNPDLIAAGLGPTESENVSFQAGRVLLTEIKEKITKGESFAFESTLSGLTYAPILRLAKTKGYHITTYFLFLDKVAMNIERIKKRVSLGGHHIPSKVVRRRQSRCFGNFWNIYRQLCNEWSVINNSNSRPKMLLNSQTFLNLSDEDKIQFEKNFLRGIL